MKHVIEHSMPHRASSRHLKWLTILLVGIILLMSCIATFWVPLITKTLIWSIIYYYWTALGIAAGYHRLWAHNAYKATPILKIFLAGVGGGAAEGSILGWCQNHRIHHRYANTEKDPYVSEKSLLYSHLSWTITKENPKRIGYVDISDLNDDPIVALQHFHYVKVVLLMGLVFPTVVSGLGWGDWCGGLIYAGILRIFFQQATSCACSLTHWLGEQSFNGRNSSRDHAITALLSLGEGYDNFHHEFPSDYRNAIGRFQCDPTKWYIRMWKQLGLAYDLKQFTAHEIEKSYIQQAQKNLDQKRASLDWGIPITQLPVLEWNNYVEQCNNGRSLIAIAGVVHDVVDFIQDHPGGKAIIKAGIGKDATGMFSGVDYDHSNAAHNVLSLMRVGIIGGDRGFEVWKLVGCADNAMQAPMISPGVA